MSNPLNELSSEEMYDYAQRHMNVATSAYDKGYTEEAIFWAVMANNLLLASVISKDVLSGYCYVDVCPHE